MVTKIPHSMTTNVLGTSNLASQTPGNKLVANSGAVVQLDSNGDIPPALLGPVADQFRITVDQAITASSATVDSTWERIDRGGQGTTPAGFQMSQSSGIFTFPITGLYLVTLNCQIARTATNIDLITSRIQFANDSFVDSENAVTHAESILGVTGTLPKEVATLSSLVNITNVANEKVRFTIQADDTGSELAGSTFHNATYATFLRIVGT